METDRKERILVVDHRSRNLEHLCRILEEGLFEVYSAKNGRRALESAHALAPDLILLDATIPDMDGYEVCRRLKKGEETCRIPVLFINVSGEDVQRNRVFEAGGADFVSKPFLPSEVLGRVRTHLELRKAQVALHCYKTSLEQEVAERKKVESALRESEERMQSILDNAPAVIYVKDIRGRYTLINRTFEELFHVGRSYFIGKTDHDIFPREIADALYANDQAVLQSGKFMQAEEEVVHDDGLHSYISVKFPLVDVRGTIYALCGISSDITQRKKAEVALQEAKEAAESANRAKSIFLANMSHELRTPLNVILGFSQLIQRDPFLSPGGQKHLEIINRSGEHLLTLINDVLEVSKIEAGRVALQNEHFDLYDFLKGIEAMFRMRADQKGLNFRVQKDSFLPPFLVGDRKKLSQVLINLLGNAVKFTDEGTIVLRVSAEESPGEMKERTWRVLFEVEDTGIGIAPEGVRKLFDPFEQTPNGKMRGGSGLGLTISRQYARLMGCDLNVRSQPGKGSVFSFACAFAQGNKEMVGGARKRKRVVGLAPGTGKNTILLVDDSEESRLFLSELLSLVGFGVREAVDGREALTAFDAEKPDLILMDMRMPVIDGYTAARRIKETAEGQKVPIIAVSASALEEERDKIIAAGADDVVRKPFRESELFDSIGRLLHLEYRYEEDLGPPCPAQEQEFRKPRDLTEVPRELREELRQALIALNVARIRQVTERIASINSSVGEYLEQLEKDYQFEALLELLKDSAEGKYRDGSR